MLAKVFSAGLSGIEAYLVEIEVDVTRGLPAVHLTGLADTAIKESRERVKTAVKNSGFSWPAERLTINLAPCSVKKEGGGFDLAIALGVLSASNQINATNLRRFCFLGELSLDGLIRPVKGILSICASLKKYRIKEIVVPWQNATEAAVVAEIKVYPAKSLAHAVEFINSPEQTIPTRVNIDELFSRASAYPVDFSEVSGQFAAKRAIEVACAGNHNLVMLGPPGCGKTMLAHRIPTILPPLTLAEALDVTKIHSAAGLLLPQDGIIAQHPFRQPHHTISYASLVGGGAIPQPGEISLAHNGVLFLDELPEFHRDALAALRQPLEEGIIRISRIHKSYTFPSSSMLVCAMNPCKCGYYNDRKSACRCSTTQIHSYRSKISGPLLNRIDIHIELPPARYQELSNDAPAESSAQIKERITAARAIQQERLQNECILYNAQMNHRQVKKFCALGKEESELLRRAMTELNFSARAYDKILKVSRTIADLAGCELIRTEHLAEAIQYRSLDRDFFL
jgi:magnesium chelatase family protein